MSEQNVATPVADKPVAAAPAKVTLTKEEYDALLRSSNRGTACSISKEDLIKALEGKSLYAASKVLGKSYAAVKNALEKYGIEYKPVERVKSNVHRKVKSYTLSEDETAMVNAIVFALKNRPQLTAEVKALADKCMKI